MPGGRRNLPSLIIDHLYAAPILKFKHRRHHHFLIINSYYSIPSLMSESLSWSNHYNHFFLLHDFFHRLSRTKARNSDYFDLQIEVSNSMKAAISTGEKITQGVAFGSLCWYFLRGRSLPMRFVYGFLFMYWYNHVITMGSYLGAFCRLPSKSEVK